MILVQIPTVDGVDGKPPRAAIWGYGAPKHNDAVMLVIPESQAEAELLWRRQKAMRHVLGEQANLSVLDPLGDGPSLRDYLGSRLRPPLGSHPASTAAPDR